jgi:hypothetical protein
MALHENLGPVSVCSLRSFPESLRSQRQHSLEACDVSALLGLLVLGQARQQRFYGGNTLSVSGFPGIGIGGGRAALSRTLRFG